MVANAKQRTDPQEGRRKVYQEEGKSVRRKVP
jgi:hypothetical protein